MGNDTNAWRDPGVLWFLPQGTWVMAGKPSSHPELAAQRKSARLCPAATWGSIWVKLHQLQETLKTAPPAALDGACKLACCCGSASLDDHRGKGSRLYRPAFSVYSIRLVLKEMQWDPFLSLVQRLRCAANPKPWQHLFGALLGTSDSFRSFCNCGKTHVV